ncbi:unnamed protein product, partial [Staurois parvus]
MGGTDGGNCWVLVDGTSGHRWLSAVLSSRCDSVRKVQLITNNC